MPDGVRRLQALHNTSFQPPAPFLAGKGDKRAQATIAGSDLWVHGHPTGSAGRGHWPCTNVLTQHLSHKVVLGPDHKLRPAKHWDLVNGLLKNFGTPAVEPDPANATVRMTQIHDEKTRRLKYVGSPFATGTFAKFSLGMDETGKLRGLHVVRLMEKLPGRKNRQSTRAVTHLDQFLEQIRILHKVGSILAPTETGVVDDKAFAVIRPMGGDVKHLLVLVGNATETVDVVLRRAVARGFARDLRRWHEAGVMHRDIKLENMLWDEGGVFALGDAGLAIEAPFYHFEELIGSPLTVAPEILFAKPGAVIGPAADMWSLGIAFLDLYGDVDLFPGGADQKFSLERARQDVEQYEAWRAARSRTENNPHDVLDWDKILSPSEADLLDRKGEPSSFHKLDRLAKDVAGQCEKSAQYIFDHLLRTRPEDRDKAPQADEALHAIDAKNHKRDEIVVNYILADCLEKDPVRQAAIKTLTQCWDTATKRRGVPRGA